MLGEGLDPHHQEAEEGEDSAQKTPEWLMEDGNVFSVYKVVTLDPSSVTEAWDRLAQDTWAMEFQSLPHIVHLSLLRTLKERGWTRR